MLQSVLISSNEGSPLRYLCAVVEAPRRRVIPAHPQVAWPCSLSITYLATHGCGWQPPGKEHHLLANCWRNQSTLDSLLHSCAGTAARLCRPSCLLLPSFGHIQLHVWSQGLFLMIGCVCSSFLVGTMIEWHIHISHCSPNPLHHCYLDWSTNQSRCSLLHGLLGTLRACDVWVGGGWVTPCLSRLRPSVRGPAFALCACPFSHLRIPGVYLSVCLCVFVGGEVCRCLCASHLAAACQIFVLYECV